MQFHRSKVVEPREYHIESRLMILTFDYRFLQTTDLGHLELFDRRNKVFHCSRLPDIGVQTPRHHICESLLSSNCSAGCDPRRRVRVRYTYEYS